MQLNVRKKLKGKIENEECLCPKNNLPDKSEFAARDLR